MNIKLDVTFLIRLDMMYVALKVIIMRAKTSWEPSRCSGKVSPIPLCLVCGHFSDWTEGGKSKLFLQNGLLNRAKNENCRNLSIYLSIYISKCWLVAWLVLWWSYTSKGFWALWDNIYECDCCYRRCHGNAVKEFWALWDHIYDCVFTASDFPGIFDGQFAGLSI
jgi:hypothetical protein